MSHQATKPQRRIGDEGPVHRVRTSRAFYIGKYEVTQEQWQKVLGERRGGFQTRPYNPRLPVETVSWDDCRAGTRARFSFGDDDDRLGEYA